MRWRALEQQVFKQMRHAGLTVVFVPRADQVGDVDCHRRLAGIRKQQHSQTVVETVLGNAFDARTSADPAWQVECLQRRHQNNEQNQCSKRGTKWNKHCESLVGYLKPEAGGAWLRWRLRRMPE